MKTIPRWASDLENAYGENFLETIQAVRNEAFDAAIKTIKEHGIYVDAYNQTLGQAIKAIEELKEK